ncbi:amino acid ABC transporter substrate-binding protein [Pyxidicoccus fallax]|uniref:Amino acid ABC transporter substrate-binding protein n=1 Tax=Pyxidicoccus fallax TaxID=394095 RepID=A0A848LTE5_9BACT|nr:transporter substrate-binding domain-containing protein [Pyxidicoccus fallax]NMO21258.1 amino acid ABC transporter substrate-binding protein [Pyxidicoccus fallax]NPC83662.1 amino acid ABC transporter substrate-binding protein [Pyxidicoccus fallax]
MARHWMGVLALWLLPWGAAAGEATPLRVALSGQYLPLHGPSRDGMTGLEAELARALGRELGREVEFIDTRRKFKLGTLEAVAAGKVDLGLNSITPTPERARQVDFTRPYLELSYRLAGPEGNLRTKELPGYTGRVAAPPGPVREAVQEAMPQATLVDCADQAECLRKVDEKQADFAAGEDVGLQLAVRDSPLVVAEAAFGRSPLAIAVPKGGAAAIDAALERLGPTLEQLKKTWKPGENHLPDAQQKLLRRLPDTLIGLRQHDGEWVRPKFCYSQSENVSFEQGGDGTWRMDVLLAQDTDMYAIHSVQETEAGMWRLKLVGPYSAGKVRFVDVGPGDEPGTWQCDPCHHSTSTFTTRAQARRFRVHDYDASSREPNGDCGPP